MSIATAFGFAKQAAMTPLESAARARKRATTLLRVLFAHKDARKAGDMWKDEKYRHAVATISRKALRDKGVAEIGGVEFPRSTKTQWNRPPS